MPVAEPHPQGNSVPQLTCELCPSLSFSMPYELNRHILRHVRPYKCPHLSCSYATEGFGSQKTLDNHISSKHPGEFPGTQRFFCTIRSCKWSEAYNNGFPREDSLKRHMTTHKELKGENIWLGLEEISHSFFHYFLRLRSQVEIMVPARKLLTWTHWSRQDIIYRYDYCCDIYCRFEIQEKAAFNPISKHEIKPL